MPRDVPLPDIAAGVGTPFYVYSTATLTRHYRLLDDALAGLDHLVCYAMKANSNQAVLALMASLGAGVDVVSGGEYARAKAAGFPGERIVFSGVGKTEGEMRSALEGGIRQFNVESEPELLRLSAVAASMGATAPITVRVNPDVDARTHEKIATGKAENKFGIPISRAREVYAEAAALPGIEVVGIDVHIGSQLTDLEPFRLAYSKIADLTRQLFVPTATASAGSTSGAASAFPTNARTSPRRCPPITGASSARPWAISAARSRSSRAGSSRGTRGVLVSSVLYVKSGEGRDFLILDSAMNDLVRPAMYGAWHDIVPVTEPVPGAEHHDFDIVGPVCEDRGYLREGPSHAAGFRGRSGGLPVDRRLWCGDGVGVQHAAPRPRSSGAGRSICRHSAGARPLTRSSIAIPSQSGSSPILARARMSRGSWHVLTFPGKRPRG